MIVVTSPGREQHLEYCLAMLCRQSLQNFEVLVIDDGSEGCRAVTEGFKGDLDLRYDYRPNDRCVSRSLNRGAALARTSQLVMLSVDVLLNPLGLEAYSHYLQRHKDWAIFSYLGWHPHSVAPSQWFSEVRVNYLDQRFDSYSQQQLQACSALFEQPHWFAVGANTCIHRELLNTLQGFNEDFVYWGQEDLDLAYRLLQKGYQIHFSLDAWGEHQIHERSGDFYDINKRPLVLLMEDLDIRYQVQILQTPALSQQLRESLFKHYIPQDQGFSPKIRRELVKPGAQLNLNNHKYIEAVCKSHLLSEQEFAELG